MSKPAFAVLYFALNLLAGLACRFIAASVGMPVWPLAAVAGLALLVWFVSRDARDGLR